MGRACTGGDAILTDVTDALARVLVLGPVLIRHGERTTAPSSGRTRAIIGLLALTGDAGMPAEVLAESAWPDSNTDPTPATVSVAVHRARRWLHEATGGTAGINRTTDRYQLTGTEVDAAQFQRLAADDTQLAEALSLWRDIPLADVTYGRAAVPAVEALTQARLNVAVRHARRLLAADESDAAVQVLMPLIDQHPLDEPPHAVLMAALAAAGHQAQALELYERIRVRLADELGIDPSRQLSDALVKVLRQDASAATTGTRQTRVVPRQLPPPPAGFTGRTSELATLTAVLDDAAAESNSVLISALAGAGGIGKTWLALHWAHAHADRFPDGQFFVDLQGFSPDSSPLDPLTVLRGFLDALGVDPVHISGGLDEHAARYRSHLTDKRMLILLDNAATAGQVIPLLPGTPSCSVLVTSRTILTPLLTRHAARHLNLDILTNADAHTLLVHRLGRARVAAEPAAVAELIRRCGRYPLALSIMASRAQAHPDLPLADLTTELRQAGLNALEDGDPITSLPTVLSWSLRALTTQQRTMFALLGLTPSTDIGLPAAASLTGISQTELRPILRTLVDASLINRHPGDRYTMHDLIRLHARDHAAHHQSRAVLDEALRRDVEFYTYTADTGDRLLSPHRPPGELGDPAAGCHPLPLADAAEALAWFDLEHAGLLAALRGAAEHGWHQLAWHLAWALTTYNWRHGNLHDALTACRAGLAAAEQLGDPAVRTIAHRRLGTTCVRLGRADDALEHLGHALELAELAHDRDQQAHIHLSLANASALIGEGSHAIDHAMRALHIRQESADPLLEAFALNVVGWYEAEVGAFEQARAHCDTALTLHRQHHNQHGEAATLDSLGYIDHGDTRYPQAVGHYLRAIALFQRVGDLHEVANTSDRLGHTYVALGDIERAHQIWHVALDLYLTQGRDPDATRLKRQLDTLPEKPGDAR